MSGPKHLWSGDWERESAESADGLTGLTPPPAPETPGEDPTPPAATHKPARSPGLVLRPLAVVVAILAIVGAGAAVGNALNSSSPTNRSSQSAAQSVVIEHRVGWLGMQIITDPNGGAVVQTVGFGTPAAVAGLEPGDVIVTVNGHLIGTAQAIRPAVANLATGALVQIDVDRGSSPFITALPLTALPTTEP